MFTVEFHKSFCREWGWSKQKILSMVPFEDKTLKDHHISFTDYFKQDIPEYSSLFMSIVRDALEEFAYKSEYKFNDVFAIMWAYQKGQQNRFYQNPTLYVNLPSE